MKTHLMNLQLAPFESIKSGKKDIEMRLYDDKRRLISANDQIIFTNQSTNEHITCKVISVTVFNNFEELYGAFDKIRLGYSEDEIANPEDMKQYYPLTEMQKNGVCAIEIQLI